MSFNINWSEIGSDASISEAVKDHLSSYLQNVSLPSFVNNLKITDFSFGAIAPTIILKEITDPLPDFYESVNEGLVEGDEGWTIPSPSDTQFLIEVEYKGDLFVTMSGELVLNYPSQEFIKLPIKLAVTNIGFHSLCLVAYLAKQIFVSILCDVSDPILDEQNSEPLLDPNGTFMAPKKPFERISIIRSMNIDTEIGQQYQGEGSTLKNVGKLEQFLLEKFKDLLRKEIAWPSWINLDLSGDNNEEESIGGEEEEGTGDEIQSDGGSDETSIS
ncbi:hypothetical protein NCAS_0D02060 [Naumovozyma castellii]|uniref:Mitochondrial distribution and morphology protein 12 n=1 Tax=Naumovozyma castellii TaxID=27288 RepID=G0VDZ7_NAUCA|nr:hypothetical protein NCAS_0D02060 [Naumovozyma castellii CBS 4309]CCC69787.1 hypothetical protein NCAS_0D02060 [Naumovozyma castellii CBS 4309]